MPFPGPRLKSMRTMQQGFVEVPHGWNNPNVNRLTDDRDTDPVGGFPNLKIVPVRVEKLFR